MSAPVAFYRCGGAEAVPDTDPLRAGAGEVRVRLWRPGEAGGPQGFSMGRAASVYAGFHKLGLFSNADYSALCIEDSSGALLHVSSIFPGYFRFPFMAPQDLQIGATYTAPEARGRKLAQLALTEAVRTLDAPGRSFWYLTEQSNAASVAVAKAAGFAYAGQGEKQPRFGINLFGAYRLTEPAAQTDRA